MRIKSPIRLRDHKFNDRLCAVYQSPNAVAHRPFENGGAGPAVGNDHAPNPDHIMLGDNNTHLPAENPVVAAAENFTQS